MAGNDPMEVFVLLLSDVRRKTERSVDFYRELNKLSDTPEVKEALESRAFIAEKTLDKIDQAFKLINQKPITPSGRLQDLLEDFRSEVNDLKNPIAKRVFVLARAIQLTHLQIGEYVALVAAADMTGHFGVGVLLESCLGEYLAFVERNRRLIRKIVEVKAQARAGA